MKTILFLSWVIIASGGYYGWTFYQKTTQALTLAISSNEEFESQIHDLKNEVSCLTNELSKRTDQLTEEQKINRDLQAAVVPSTPASIPSQQSISDPSPSSPDISSIPSTITTVTGKTYQQVKVVKVEDDAITILDSEGGALIPLDQLPSDLQAKLNYNPVRCKMAKDAREKTNATALTMIEDEKNQAAAIQKMKLIALTSPSNSVISENRKITKTPAEIEAIQNQIASLQADVNFMQAEETKVINEGTREIVRANGRTATEGAYAQRIKDENAQIQDLQAQLR